MNMVQTFGCLRESPLRGLRCIHSETPRITNKDSDLDLKVYIQ